MWGSFLKAKFVHLNSPRRIPLEGDHWWCPEPRLSTFVDSIVCVPFYFCDLSKSFHPLLGLDLEFFLAQCSLTPHMEVSGSITCVITSRPVSLASCIAIHKSGLHRNYNFTVKINFFVDR